MNRLAEMFIPRKIIKRSEYYSRYEGKTDPYGFSPETVEKWHPIFQFFYEEYFHVKTVGLENIPAEGRAVLAGNHSGVLPIDAFMTSTAVLLHHKEPRRIRYLAHDFLLSNKYSSELLKGFGGVPARYEVAKELIEDEELVFFYPEGTRGTGKPFSQRYRLQDFDPGFVKAALETGSPIIPVTTVGGDEIYPMLFNLKWVANLLGTPYWPVTPTFPLMPYPVACLPLPIKFLINIGKPIHLDYPPEKASDKKLRMRLAREIQYDIQRELNSLLRERKSPFAGWENQP